MCIKLSVNSVIVHFSMDIKQHIGINKYKDCPHKHNQVVILLYKIKWSVLWSVYWIKKNNDLNQLSQESHISRNFTGYQG